MDNNGWPRSNWGEVFDNAFTYFYLICHGGSESREVRCWFKYLHDRNVERDIALREFLN